MASALRFAGSNKKEGPFMVDHNTTVTEDELHVYVDGELPADRREAVETWLSNHRRHCHSTTRALKCHLFGDNQPLECVWWLA